MDSLNKKILIVEDERSMVDVIKDKLTQEGFTVLVAYDGLEGLGAAFKERPDMILLDILMPKMDGITMLKKLRENNWGKSAKVVVLSNLSSDQAVSDSLKNGVYDYLIKTDWHLNDLVKVIKSRLGLTDMRH